MSQRAEQAGGGLDVPGLTWPLLLARWVAFAQGAGAQPPGPAGDRWRAAAPSVIHLQAAVFALAELEQLAQADRAYAVDRASYLVEQHAGVLERLWTEAGEALHPEVRALIDDARAAVLAARERSGGPFSASP